MLYFLRAYDVKAMRRKLAGLYILNVLDALLTFILIRTGCVYEANLLLGRVMSDIGRVFIIKILFPAAIIAWLCLRIQQATEKQLKLGNAAVNFVFLLYLLVNALHLVWVVSFLAIEIWI